MASKMISVEMTPDSYATSILLKHILQYLTTAHKKVHESRTKAVDDTFSAANPLAILVHLQQLCAQRGK